LRKKREPRSFLASPPPPMKRGRRGGRTAFIRQQQSFSLSKRERDPGERGCLCKVLQLGGKQKTELQSSDGDALPSFGLPRPRRRGVGSPPRGQVARREGKGRGKKFIFFPSSFHLSPSLRPLPRRTTKKPGRNDEQRRKGDLLLCSGDPGHT
jgi:hypothetical protein